jgi:hypothetical protein
MTHLKKIHFILFKLIIVNRLFIHDPTAAPRMAPPKEAPK